MSWVNSICFTPDDRRFVIGSDEFTAVVWDMSPRKKAYALKGHTAEVTGVDVTPDGQRLLSASRDCTGRVWVNPSTYVKLVGHTSPLTCIQALPGDRALTGSLDGTAKIWDITTGTAQTTFEGHKRGIQTVFAHRNRVVTGSMDTDARIWDMDSGIQMGSLQGHSELVSALHMDDQYIITGSPDTNVRVWDAKHWVPLEKLTVSAEVSCLCRRNNILYVGTLDGNIHIFDACFYKLGTMRNDGGFLTCMAFSSDGKYLAMGFDRGFTIKSVI